MDGCSGFIKALSLGSTLQKRRIQKNSYNSWRYKLNDDEKF